MRFLIWKCKEQTLFSKEGRQFGLKSFGHLISNWRRFRRNKSLLFVFCISFLSSLIWRNRNVLFLLLQFEIKTVCRLMSNCGEMGDHFVSSKFECDV